MSAPGTGVRITNVDGVITVALVDGTSHVEALGLISFGEIWLRMELVRGVDARLEPRGKPKRKPSPRPADVIA